MDSSSLVSQSTSFFALKKSINLINLIAKYLNSNQKVEWNDVLKSQKDLQQFINSAVLSYFPGEDLNSYKLHLPTKIKANNQVDNSKAVTSKVNKNKNTKKSVNGNVNLNENENNDKDVVVLEHRTRSQNDLGTIYTPVEVKDDLIDEDAPLFGSYIDYPHLYDNPKTTSTNNELETLKSKRASSNHSISSSISTDEGSTDVGFYRESNIKDPSNYVHTESQQNISYESNGVNSQNLLNNVNGVKQGNHEIVVDHNQPKNYQCSMGNENQLNYGSQMQSEKQINCGSQKYIEKQLNQNQNKNKNNTSQRNQEHYDPDEHQGSQKLQEYYENQLRNLNNGNEHHGVNEHKGNEENPDDNEYNDENDENLLDYQYEGECTGLPDVLDHLTEARKKYMGLINSKGISCLDSSIPQHMISPKTAHLFQNNFPFSAKVEHLNRTVFGYTHFRGVQLAAINSIMLGHDCFVMMATGVGKSHCYQLPSLLLEGTVVVFSPLLSLVEDQIQSLSARGIEAQTLNGQSSVQEFKSVVKSLTQYSRSFENGSILFITPEKFDKSKAVLNLLEKLHDMDRLKLFVIDEAHCVSQWGHSFRQDYRKLCNLKENFPTVPILAITATATSDVINDITSVLQFRNHVSLRTTINRPNLWIEVREKTNKYMDEIIEILNSTSGCGIIYCLTTSDCERIAEKIYKNGISVAVYHSKMELEDRVASQKLWKTGDIRIIVATVAFGMGIDKPDVRFILHTSAPTSILSYYQEIGRAGRDGKFSITILWYSTRDFERHKNINEAKSNRTTMFSSEMRDFCKNRTTCRRMMILEAFGEESHITSCLGCDNCCLKLATKVTDVTEEAIMIVNFIQESMMRRKKGFLTANILVDALRGSKKKNVTKYRLEENQFHGSLKMHKQKYILDILLQMVKMKLIKECRRQSMSFGRTVLITGPAAANLLKGFLRVNITCYQEPEPLKNKNKKNKGSGSGGDEDDDDDDEDDSTETGGKKKKKSKKKKDKDDDGKTSSTKSKKKTSNKETNKKNKSKSKESASSKKKKQSKELSITPSQTTLILEPSGVIDLTYESDKSNNNSEKSLKSEKSDESDNTNKSDEKDNSNNSEERDNSNNESGKVSISNTQRMINDIFDKPLEMEYEEPSGSNTLNTQNDEILDINKVKMELDLASKLKDEVNFELFSENIVTQTQKEISVSDIITAEMNNIRRKIPGALLQASQP